MDIKLAELTEQVIHEKLETQYGSPFSLDSAYLYAVTMENSTTPVLTLVTQHPDIYRLLSLPTSETVETVRKSDFVAVVTTGWAAPLPSDGSEPETMPSEHAERRRVRLCVFASLLDTVASVLRFEDDDETVTDEGQATGALAEAVHDFVGIVHSGDFI